MVWAAEIEELRQREELAKAGGGPQSVARHHAAGKLTVRERIALLTDPGSFHETGRLSGKATYEGSKIVDYQPSNLIMGIGRVDGRRVVVAGEDFTVRGGSAEARMGDKMGYSEQMAVELRLPLIRLVDGTGGSVKSIEMEGHTYVPGHTNYQIMAEAVNTVPVIGASMGSVSGLGSVRVVASHFSLMPRETAQLFVAGPPLVKRAFGVDIRKEDLGNWQISCESGAVDNDAADEEDVFRQIRAFLSFMPQNVWQQPRRTETGDPCDRREDGLIAIVPRSKRQSYDMRELLDLVLDRGSFFEMGLHFGRSLITGLARLDGFPVGVMANNPQCDGGAITAAAAEKMIRFVDMCDMFHLPVVNFVDNPGYMIGLDAEFQATIRKGTRSLFAVYQARVPWVSILVRRVYGVAGGAHGNTRRLNLRFAWPSGEWGSLPMEGGIEAAYRRDIESAPDPAARFKEIEERLKQLSSPFRTAEVFGVEEIIDPRNTRPILCDWVDLAYEIESARLGPTLRSFRP